MDTQQEPINGTQPPAGGNVGNLFGDPAEQQAPAQGQAQTPVAQAPQTQASSEVRLADDAVEKLAAAVRAGSAQQAPAQQMSQEDFDRLFHVMRPDQQMLNAIRSGDEAAALAALTQFSHGTAKQAIALASYQFQLELAKIREAVAPALGFVQEQQMQRLESEFYEQHSDLKGYEPVLKAIRDGFVAKGAQFKSKEEAFKAVAEEARKILKGLPNAQTTGSVQKQAGSMPALANARGGAGTGDRSSSNGQGSNPVKKLFG